MNHGIIRDLHIFETIYGVSNMNRLGLAKASQGTIQTWQATRPLLGSWRVTLSSGTTIECPGLGRGCYRAEPKDA